MFDKRNMTITPCASGQARQPGPWDGPAGMVRQARLWPSWSAVCVCGMARLGNVRGYPLNHCLRLVVSIVWLVQTN